MWAIFHLDMKVPLFIYIPQITDPDAKPNLEHEKWPYLHFSPNNSSQIINVDQELMDNLISCCSSYFNTDETGTSTTIKSRYNPTNESPLYCGQPGAEKGDTCENDTSTTLGRLLFPEQCKTNSDCRILIKDLKSRMNSTTIIGIELPSDELISAQNILLNKLGEPELNFQEVPLTPLQVSTDKKISLMKSYSDALIDQADKNPNIVAIIKNKHGNRLQQK